jgi:putative ABC transporter, permease protein
MRELGKQIQEGTLTTLLLRPVSILNQSLATFIGKKFFMIIIYVTGILTYGFLGYFKDKLYFVEVLVFMILCFMMFFYLLSFLSTVGFWLIEVWPIQVIMIGVYSLFSGVFFPLDLLPERIYNIFKYNPFSLIGFISVRTIQGMYSHREMAVYILVTVLWMVILRIGYEKAFRKGLKRYEGVGA